MTIYRKILMISAATLLLAACSSMQMGSQDAKTTATGSAAGSSSQNANSSLEHCTAPYGTVSVIEDQSAAWYGSYFSTYHLGSTVPVIKLLVQQSGCFVVVDRGAGLNAAMRERELNSSGELRQGSQMHKGQMVAADYTISPTVTFSENDSGGLSAGLIGIFSPVAGTLAGSMHSKEASTLLTLVDNRSSLQLSAAEGSAKNIDFGGLGGLFGGGFGGGLGAYSNTSQGKVIVAAFTDSYNNLVRAMRNYRAQDVQGGLGKGGNIKVN